MGFNNLWFMEVTWPYWSMRMSEIKVGDKVEVISKDWEFTKKHFGSVFTVSRVATDRREINVQEVLGFFHFHEVKVIESIEDVQTIAELDEMLGYFMENN